MEIQLQAFLTSATDRGEWSASCPNRFTPGTLWIRGFIGPTSDLDAVERRPEALLHTCRESNPSRPAHGRVTILTDIYYYGQ